MKTIAKTMVILFILTPLMTLCQKYEHRIDSVSLGEGVNFEHSTILKPDSLCKINGIKGEGVVVKDISIRFIGHYDSNELVYVDIEIRTTTGGKESRPTLYKERVYVSLWEEDEEHEFGVGTIVIAGERGNGEWFMYAQNLEKNLYSFHFVDLDKEKDVVFYTSKNK